MDKTTVTFRELRRFRAAAMEYIQANPKAAENKFHWALKRVLDSTEGDMIRLSAEEQNARLDGASCDKDGNLMYIDKEATIYKMRPEKLKTVEGRLREIGATEVEISPYYATVVPGDLAFGYIMAFERFVIRPSDHEQPEVE